MLPICYPLRFKPPPRVCFYVCVGVFVYVCLLMLCVRVRVGSRAVRWVPRASARWASHLFSDARYFNITLA